MKPLFFSMLFVLGAACGGSETKGESKDTQIIGVDDKAAAASASCDQEIALDCAEGFVDGCGVGDESGASLTLWHICIPASENAAGPACEQEIARVCEDGSVDACLLTPPAATSHVCVSQPLMSEDIGSEPDPDPDAEEEEEDTGPDSE